jgi:hypothetical protein
MMTGTKKIGVGSEPHTFAQQPFGCASSSIDKRNAGAGEGIRTLDPDLGKVVLYP